MDQNSPIASILRNLGCAAAAVVAAKGFTDAATAQAFAGAIVTFGLTIWGAVAKKPKALAASAAKASGGA